MAAAACVALAVPVGVLAARHRGEGSAVLERATFIGHALPGIVVAISMVFVGVRLLRPVYQEAPLLVLAYVVLFFRWPWARSGPRSRAARSGPRRPPGAWA